MCCHVGPVGHWSVYRLCRSLSCLSTWVAMLAMSAIILYIGLLLCRLLFCISACCHVGYYSVYWPVSMSASFCYNLMHWHHGWGGVSESVPRSGICTHVIWIGVSSCIYTRIYLDNRIERIQGTYDTVIRLEISNEAIVKSWNRELRWLGIIASIMDCIHPIVHLITYVRLLHTLAYCISLM